MNNKIICLFTAAMLLLCLTPMPYGFYTLVRFVSMCVFAYLAYDYFCNHKEGLGFTFAALALLFQPFVKVALGRAVWNVVDVVVAVGLVYLFFITRKENK